MQTKKISDLPTLKVADKTLLIPCIDALATATATVTAEQIAELGGGTPGLGTVDTPQIKSGAVLAANVGFTGPDFIISRADPNAGVGSEFPCTQFGRDWLALANSTAASTLLNLQLFNNPTFTGTLTADDITADNITASVSLTAPSITGDSTIVRINNPALALAAWVNFNGANGSIRAGHNVTSITRIDAGRYRVNFTNPLPDTDYCVVLTPGGTFDVNISRTGLAASGTDDRTTSQFPFILGRRSNGNYADAAICHVAVFR
jgi:hypothetical protein